MRNGPNVRLAVHFGIIFGPKWTASPSFFLGTFVFLQKTRVRFFESPPEADFALLNVQAKNSVFWGLIGYKRGGRFGKCTKMIPFWTDFVFFVKIKDI
jgi:hypothetical protein